MKKQFIKKMLFIVLFIPIFINARVNYEDAVSYVNNYIYGIDDYRDYIYLNENLPYSFEENGNKVNADFKSGGFLSRKEYELSNAKGNSYLSNGLQYWTLTKSSYLKHYIIDYKVTEQFDTNLSGVRITEYIKPTVKVSGKGSYGDPWSFEKMYSVYVNSANFNMGGISETPCSDIGNIKEGIHLSLTENESRPIYLCPKKETGESVSPYRVLTNSCSEKIRAVHGADNQYMVSELDKDNIVCKITFAHKTEDVTLVDCKVTDANGGVHSCTPVKASPNKFYVNTQKGLFFYDENAQNQFSTVTGLPSITGYDFGGYVTSSGEVVVNPTTGKLTYKSSIGKELTPKMTPKKSTVTFNANTGTNLSKTSYVVTYNQKYSDNGGLAEVQKAGNEFLGWYTQASGGTKINNSDLVKITTDTTLYAQWKTCPAGTQSDGVKCTGCPAGTYAAAGSTSCTACSAGTYSAANAGQCTSCAAGSYNTGTGNTTCTKCPAGQYNTGTGNTSCTKCAAGKYNTGTGNTTCTSCSAGSYNTGTGNTSCTKCAAGTYNTTTGQTTCTACSAGSYNTGTGNTTCTKCPGGRYNTSSGQTSCTACAAGSYNTGTGNTTCYKCDAGSYNTTTGQTSCTKCTAGTYNTGVGNTTCLNCPAGTYSGAGANTCTACAAGTYSAEKAASCTACAAGKYNTGTGNTTCNSCPAGQYNTGTGNTSCTACAAGKYNTGTGNTTCTNCPAGKYSSNTGSTSCTDCAAGTYSSAGASKCTACAAGTYSAKGASSCSSCAAGSYNTGTGNTTCTTCPAGKYNSGTGNTTCTTCTAGYYCPGGPTRTPCPSGQTSPAGSDAANDCYVPYRCSKGTLTNNGTYGYICTYGPSYGYIGDVWDSCANWGVVGEECDSCGDYGISHYVTVSCSSSCSGCNDGICGPPNDGCWGGSSGKAYCSCPKFGCIETCWDEYGCIGGYVRQDGYYCPDNTLSGSGSSMTCFSYATRG